MQGLPMIRLLEKPHMVIQSTGGSAHLVANQKPDNGRRACSPKLATEAVPVGKVGNTVIPTQLHRQLKSNQCTLTIKAIAAIAIMWSIERALRPIY